VLTRLGSMVLAAAAAALFVVAPRVGAAARDFDLQAHQGGPGSTHTGESLPAFANALETGVSTLELDIGITSDQRPVVWHDKFIDPHKCADTSPLFAGDPQFPYVGKLVHELTLAQLRTLNCGGNKIAILPEVFDLTKRYNADVRYDIETKVDPEHPSATASPETFVDLILAAVRDAGRVDRVEIESFDWRTLRLVHQAEPSMPTMALWDAQTWTAGSPWLAGVDPATVVDPVIGAKTVGATLLSPEYPLVDRDLVDRAHALGLNVIPWTVDNADEMRALIADGVDGIITNYPAVLRGVLGDLGMPLPRAYHRN
jgi:glycerophosphoryl diester phosphodiesterase